MEPNIHWFEENADDVDDAPKDIAKACLSI